MKPSQPNIQDFFKDYLIVGATVAPFYVALFTYYQAYYCLALVSCFIAGCLIAYVFNRFSYTKTAAQVYVFSMFFCPSAGVVVSGGVHSPIMIWLLPVIVLAGALLGRRWMFAYGFISFSFIFSMSIDLQSLGIINEFPQGSPGNRYLTFLVYLSTLATVVRFVFVKTRTHELTTDSLRAETKAANELSRLKSKFLAHMSHELKTPISGILGLTNILSSSTLSAEQQKYVKTVNQSSQYLLSTINNVLELSKLETGDITAHKSSVNVSHLVASSVQMIAPLAKEKSLDLNFSVDNTPNIITDSERLKQIIINLLGNAVKFTEHGSIELVAKLQRKQLSVSISDSGIGIAKDKQENIFRAFNQIDEFKEGSGLGLTIVSELVRLLDGKLTLKSRPGKGTKVSFSLPVEIADNFPLSKSSTEGRHYLVADDNEVNQIVIKGMLETSGAKVDLVANGADAVATLKRNQKKYDAVLMDCRMPILDGFDATSQIRQFSKIPIVAVTANNIDEERRECFDRGMNAYIAKPFNLDQINDVLNQTHSSASIRDP